MLIETLHLGIQTNADKVVDCATWKARQWAPKKARSWTICFRDTDYYKNTQYKATGYASIEVVYFSTLKEGLISVRSSVGTEYVVIG